MPLGRSRCARLGVDRRLRRPAHCGAILHCVSLSLLDPSLGADVRFQVLGRMLRRLLQWVLPPLVAASAPIHPKAPVYFAVMAKPRHARGSSSIPMAYQGLRSCDPGAGNQISGQAFDPR